MENQKQAIIKQQITTGNRGLQLQSLDDMYRFGQYVTESGLAPDSFKTPEQVLVALQTGAEINLSPMQSLNSIVVIKGKPTLWGDAALALVKRSGLLGSYSEKVTGEGDDMCAYVSSVRRAVAEGEGECVVETVFNVADAKTAKLWGKAGPWCTHPKRMLKYKARAFNLRDNFPDVLFGMHLAEEMQGEETLSAPESTVQPREKRRMAVPSTDVSTTRAQVKACLESVVENQRLASDEEKLRAGALGTQVSPEVAALVEEEGQDKIPVEKPELVLFLCKACGQTFHKVKEEGEGAVCECGKGILKQFPEQQVPTEEEVAALEEEVAAFAKEEKPEPVGLYDEVIALYESKNGGDFIEFAAYVLCLDDSEVEPEKLDDVQLKEIKTYIKTS